MSDDKTNVTQIKSKKKASKKVAAKKSTELKTSETETVTDNGLPAGIQTKQEHATDHIAGIKLADFVNLAINAMKPMPAPWNQLCKADQDEAIEDMTDGFRSLLSEAVGVIQEMEFTQIDGELVNPKIGKNDITAGLVFDLHEAKWQDIFANANRRVKLVIPPEGMVNEGDIPKGEPDQKGIDLQPD